MRGERRGREGSEDSAAWRCDNPQRRRGRVRTGISRQKKRGERREGGWRRISPPSTGEEKEKKKRKRRNKPNTKGEKKKESKRSDPAGLTSPSLLRGEEEEREMLQPLSFSRKERKKR